MHALLLALLAAGPFPLPTIDGKPLAMTEKQTTFRLPMRFEKVKAFYEEQLGHEKDPALTVKMSGAPGARVLALTSRRPGDAWAKAFVREKEVETVVEVTPVILITTEQITGNGRPLVQFVMGRSGDVDGALKTIDHTEAMRAK